MAVLICDAVDCVHRSKRAMRKWEARDGGKCYGCKRQYTVIRKPFDPDEDIEAVAGDIAVCAWYQPRKEVSGSV